MKLISWNVNGLRSANRQGFADWLASSGADVVCLQETKAWPEQLGEDLLAPDGYQAWWSCAEKKGYSGVCVYSTVSPEEVVEGLGIEVFDREGRVLTLRFGAFTVVNAYFPNGQRDHARVPFKMEFCAAFQAYCDGLQQAGEELVLCGDFNTAHREIDLKRPRDNKNTTGFLPVERAWMEEFVATGYIDIFRRLCSEPDHYTWWSNRSGVRERNVGWRIDYHFISPSLEPKVRSAYHLPDVRGSDHCPIGLDLWL